MRRTHALLLLSAGLLGCQVYDLTPVTPFSVVQKRDVERLEPFKPKPNMLVLVDRSGSMANPLDVSDARCAGCGDGTPCPVACPTKERVLKAALATFLTTGTPLARLALASFPSSASACAASSTLDVPFEPASARDDDTALRAKGVQVANAVAALTMGGGTPTAAALDAVAQSGALTDATDARKDYVLLVTDGLPNCNATNPNHVCSAPNAACRCTQPAGCTGSAVSFTPCSQGCLDTDATVLRIAELRQRGVTTIVLGFGAELATSDAALTLNAMATAGGFERSCPAADPTCASRRYFQATDAAELTQALEAIAQRLPADACDFQLDFEPDPGLLSVSLGGAHLPTGADTWRLIGTTLSFVGAACDRLKSTPGGLELDVQYVKSVR